MHQSTKETGLTTIEEVRAEIEQEYETSNMLIKIMYKAWSYHSESRHRNGNKPFTFVNYTSHMYTSLYIEQINLDMLDCSDIGGKEAALDFLKSRL